MRNDRLTNWLCVAVVALWILIIINILRTGIFTEPDDQKLEESPVIIHWPMLSNSIACHKSLKGDALQSVEDPSFSPKSKSIFFHETSCRGGIDSRQACAVESAARAHPDWDVHLLFNSPVSKNILNKSCIAKLRQYPNVKVARVVAYSFSKYTIVHSIVKQIEKSHHPIEHTADIIRMLTLNKWGGVYLDLDVLVINPFYPLPPNWIAKETVNELSTGAMAFSNDRIGKDITNAVLEEIFKTYKATDWSFNGAMAIQRVLLRRCSKDFVNKTGVCSGVSVYGSELFYPVNYTRATLYFNEGNPSLASVQKPYTVHLWDAMTKVYTVRNNSPYRILAKKYCPKIYGMYGNSFGV